MTERAKHRRYANTLQPKYGEFRHHPEQTSNPARHRPASATPRARGSAWHRHRLARIDVLVRDGHRPPHASSVRSGQAAGASGRLNAPTFCEQDRRTCTWRMDVDEQVRRDARVERPALVLARAMGGSLGFRDRVPMASATAGV
jgi:hypothetical protein